MTKVIESDCGNTTVLAGDEVPSEFYLDEAASTRVQQMLQNEPQGTFLRIAVRGGGCAGFQHLFGFDDEFEMNEYIITNPSIEDDTPMVVIDPVSLELLKGSTLQYIREIGGEFFKIDNPHASSSCGCGKSFGM